MKTLLLIDAVVNLLLGLVLLLFPIGVGQALGLPPSNTYFYTTILGAVVFGIGVALIVECGGLDRGARGLGLHGAIAINICGASALAIWLLVKPSEIPLLVRVVLWAVAVVVLMIAVAEIAVKPGQHRD
jgi:hypothetical protein